MNWNKQINEYLIIYNLKLKIHVTVFNMKNSFIILNNSQSVILNTFDETIEYLECNETELLMKI